MASELDPGELFALDPEEFVAARNALAKALRAAGDRATATTVAALRRPPVSAWALNQVARRQAGLIDELLDDAARLAAALAGDGDDVRGAQSAFRTSRDAVIGAAIAIIEGAGRPVTTDTRLDVQHTVQTAAVDPDVAAALRLGVVADALGAPGFALDPTVAARVTRRAPATPTTAAARARERWSIDEAADAPSTENAAAARARRDQDAKERAAAKQAERERVAREREAAREQERLERQREEERREARRQRRLEATRLRAEVTRLAKRSARLDSAADAAELLAAERRSEAVEARAELDALVARLTTLDDEARADGDDLR